MLYKMFGYMHAQIHWRVREIRRLAGEAGQGTVEYVGLILLVAGVLAAVVVWATSKAGDQGIGKKVTDQLKTAIDQTAGGAHK